MPNPNSVAISANAPLTVESALAELREMFPDVQIAIGVRDCGEETVTVRGTQREWSIQIGMNGQDFDADTLDLALQAVRDWREKQDG